MLDAAVRHAAAGSRGARRYSANSRIAGTRALVRVRDVDPSADLWDRASRARTGRRASRKWTSAAVLGKRLPITRAPGPLLARNLARYPCAERGATAPAPSTESAASGPTSRSDPSPSARLVAATVEEHGAGPEPRRPGGTPNAPPFRSTSDGSTGVRSERRCFGRAAHIPRVPARGGARGKKCIAATESARAVLVGPTVPSARDGRARAADTDEPLEPERAREQHSGHTPEFVWPSGVDARRRSKVVPERDGRGDNCGTRPVAPSGSCGTRIASLVGNILGNVSDTAARWWRGVSARRGGAHFCVRADSGACAPARVYAHAVCPAESQPRGNRRARHVIACVRFRAAPRAGQHPANGDSSVAEQVAMMNGHQLAPDDCATRRLRGSSRGCSAAPRRRRYHWTAAATSSWRTKRVLG